MKKEFIKYKADWGSAFAGGKDCDGPLGGYYKYTPETADESIIYNALHYVNKGENIYNNLAEFLSFVPALRELERITAGNHELLTVFYDSKGNIAGFGDEYWKVTKDCTVTNNGEVITETPFEFTEAYKKTKEYRAARKRLKKLGLL